MSNGEWSILDCFHFLSWITLDLVGFTLAGEVGIKHPRRKRTGYFRIAQAVDLREALYTQQFDFLRNFQSCFHRHAFQPCSRNIHPSKTPLPTVAFSPADNA